MEKALFAGHIPKMGLDLLSVRSSIPWAEKNRYRLPMDLPINLNTKLIISASNPDHYVCHYF
jgi:hypothetical protein